MNFQDMKNFANLKKWKSLGDFNQTSFNNCYWGNGDNTQECRFSHYNTTDNYSEVSSPVEDRMQIRTEFAEVVRVLERKINKLNDMLQEQQNLLKRLKQDLAVPRVEVPALTTAFKPESLEFYELLSSVISDSEIKETTNTKARSLLDAIELKHSQRLDHHIKDALTNFLQSDELKSHVSSATVNSLKDVIGSYFSEVFPTTYLPVLENSYRRLFKHVTKCIENAFNELEQNVSMLYKSVYKTSRNLRFALENHQVLLENSRPKNSLKNFEKDMEGILNKEIQKWRQELLQVFVPDVRENSPIDKELESKNLSSFMPPSPPQPADPERSIIDQLMKSAEIIKQIKEGNANRSFEEALSSSDLSLVMAACRAADPGQIFAEPCRLQQAVLLSLLQQLATDMVHDTQLKCRYLEDAIINLKPSDPATRAHLPLVVREVRTHLTKFLNSYPSHVASRRITLIIMAADNLIK